MSDILPRWSLLLRLVRTLSALDRCPSLGIRPAWRYHYCFKYNLSQTVWASKLPGSPPRIWIALSLCIALIVLGVNGGVLQAAHQESCPGEPEEPYWKNVRAETPRPKLNRSLSRVKLGLMTGHGPGNILGLYTTGFKMEWAATYAAEPYGDAYCFWVKGVDVILRYETPDVYVAKEYLPGSCNYKVILGHEMEHVKVAQNYLKRYVQRVRSVLISLLIPKPKSAIVVDSPDHARRETNRLVQKLLGPVYDELQRVMGEAQEKVDAPQKYRKAFRLCPKW